MTIACQALDILCPMHLVLSVYGRITQAGPSLVKLCAGKDLPGAGFFDLFDIYRPRAIDSIDQLLGTAGRKLHLRLRFGRRVGLKAVVVPHGEGGAIMNLSFGIGVVDAVRDFNLTASDFAPTDLAIEMLYLVEAKSAAMDVERQPPCPAPTTKLAGSDRCDRIC